MKTLLDYKNSCRICLRSDGGPTNVYHYSIPGYQKPLTEIIFTLFKIKWQKHTAFPEFLCRRCSIEMEQVLLFKKEVEQNQLYLAQLFQNTKPKFTCTTKLEAKPAVNTSQSYVDINGLCSNIVIVDQPTPKSERRTYQTKNRRKQPNRNVSKKVSSISDTKLEIKQEDTLKKELPQETDFHQAEYSSMSLSTTPPPEQEVFLQNLNLLTLQEAEVIRKKESKQTGNDLTPKKSAGLKSHHTAKSKDKLMSKCLLKKKSRRRRRSRRLTESAIHLQNRSLDFLNRYGCRKVKNSIQLKDGRTILKSQDVNFNFNQIRLKRKRIPKTSKGCENTSVQRRKKNNPRANSHQLPDSLN